MKFVWTKAVSGEHAHGAEEHDLGRRGDSGKGLQLSSHAGKPVSAGNTGHVASASRFDRFVHEEQHLSSLESFDFGALSKKGEGEEKRVRTKNDVVALLRTQGDSWCQWLEGLPESFLSEQVRQPGGALKTRFEMLVGTKEHEMHHRGQSMLME